jgi:hypothetical protein
MADRRETQTRTRTRRRSETGTEYGEAWVYESIVGALPGVEVPNAAAIAIQFLGFETLVVVLWAAYDLPRTALVAGTVAVTVAAIGSAVMLLLGGRLRSIPAPEQYRRLLFGSSVEVVLGVLAFVALVTHLFVYDPQQAGEPLVETLFGPPDERPTPVVYITLLVLWDVVYRIGTGWWACVVALWRSYRFSFDSETARAFQRADAINLGFGLTQTLLLPFVLDRPVLLLVVTGHVLAVVGVSAASIAMLQLRTPSADEELTPS